MAVDDRQGTPTPKPLLRRLHWVLLGIAAVVLIVTVTVVRLIRVASTDPPPQSAELVDIALDAPAAASISSVFDPQKGMPQRLVVSDKRWHVISDRRTTWREDPAEDLSAINTGALAELRTMFFTAGCTPAPSEELERRDSSQALHWVDHTSGVLAVRAVLWAEMGRHPEAVDELVAVGEHLLRLEQQCAVDLAGAMILSHAIGQAHAVARWVLAADVQDDDAFERMWRHLHELETRASPLPNAFRREHQIMLAQLTKRTRNEQRNWPYYDEGDTEELLATNFRRLVWLAEAEPTHGVLGTTYPEQRWRQEIAEQPGYMSMFRFNAFGRAAIIVSNQESGRYIGSWHQDRCRLAARRHAWGATLADRGSPAPSGLPVPLNPWTAKPFGAANHGESCRAPEAIGAPAIRGPLPDMPPERSP